MDKNSILDELSAYIGKLQIDSESKETLLMKVNRVADAMEQEAIEKHCIEENWKKSSEKCSFYEAAIDALPNPVFIKNKEGKFVYFNAAYQEYFNMERKRYLNKTVLDLTFLPQSERERYQAEDLELIQSGNIKHYEMDFQVSSGEIGHSLYWSRGFEALENQEKGLIGEIVDISALKKLQAKISVSARQLQEANMQIEKMMSLDCLTGLYNRRVIQENIDKINGIMNVQKSYVSLIMADLDYFKRVNDTFGHAVGDEILVQFANILLACNRKDDLIIRFGGEEFLIILFHTKEDAAEAIAERIRIKTEEQLFLPDGKTNTVSLGVSQVKRDEDIAVAINRVDQALYCAKNTGRNKVFSL